MAGKVNILLVDDRVENLVSLSAILDSPEYNLVHAGSGLEALRHLLDTEFALILLDVQMPVMDGFETANVIKQRDKSKHIPIIFVTALSADAPFLFKGYSAGAVDYMVKPVDPTILRSKVAVFADLHRKTKQLVEFEGIRREQAMFERYRDLVNGIHDGVVWSLDFQTMEFTFLSPQVERIAGEADFRRQILSSNLLLKFRERALEGLREGTSPARHLRFEHSMRKSDGTSLWLQTGVRLAEGGTASGWEFRGISFNISRLKQSEQEAQSAIRVRDQFLSIASHELKTPLTPLSLQLEILQRMSRSGTPPDVLGKTLASSMGRMERQIDRLNHLIDELLDVSRINNGKLLLELENVSLSSLVQEVCERYSQDLVRSGSTIKLNLTDEIVGRWDRLRIEQVLVNLLTNAVKYGEGKPIEIETRREGDHAVFLVRDSGIGIKEEDQQRIFALYERAVSPMNFGGLGLGLFIVQQIVEAHGGQITLESEENKGSTFLVRIPLQKVTSPRPTASVH